MSVKDVYLLPVGVRAEIHNLMEFEDIDPKDIMKMINDRYEGQIKISLADLKEYIKVMRSKAESPVPVPMSQAVVSTAPNPLSQEKKVDNSPLADYRNSRQIMDMFRQDIVSGFTNLKRMKDDAYARNQVLTDLEAIMLNYMKIGGTLMEQEGKLKLDMQESNKNIEYVRDEIRKILMLIKSVLKKNLNEHKFREIMDLIAQALELYKFKM